MKISHLLSSLSLSLLLAPVAMAADISEITADDYYGSAYYKEALEHPKIAKQKSERRKLKMVARDMRWSKKKLRKAVEKVDTLDGNATDLAVAAIKEALGETRVKGRVLSVLVSDAEPKHVVMYIRWRGSKAKEAVKEASEIAATVAKKVPMITTLSLAAIHPKSPDTSKTPVWSAKIGTAAAARISPERIDSYADKMYARLFEDVKKKHY